jgi:hypothetical protein
MITLALHLFRVLLFGGHRQLALENLALQQQLAVYKRTVIRPPLRRTDRLFFSLRNCTLEQLAGLAIDEGEPEIGGTLTQTANDALAVLGVVRGGVR